MLGPDIGAYLAIVLVTVFCGSIAVGFGYVGIQKQLALRRGNRALHLWLQENGFEEIATNDSGLWAVLGELPRYSGRFGRTHVRKAYVSRRDWAVIYVSDLYHRSSSSGSGTRTATREHVCIVSHPEMQLPFVQVTPAQSLVRGIMRFTECLYRLVQQSDQQLHVRIPDDPTFSESFLVMGRDDDAVRGLLTPTLRRFLVDLRPANVSFGASGQSFNFDYARYIGPDDAAAMLKQAEILVMLFRGEVGDVEARMGRGDHMLNPPEPLRAAGGKSGCLASLVILMVAATAVLLQAHRIARWALIESKNAIMEQLPADFSTSERSSFEEAVEMFADQIGENVTMEEVHAYWVRWSDATQDLKLSAKEVDGIRKEIRNSLSSPSPGE